MSTYTVLDFGAVGDGQANDAAAIQRAIDACTASGGGTVLLPAGKTFRSGTIAMRGREFVPHVRVVVAGGSVAVTGGSVVAGGAVVVAGGGAVVGGAGSVVAAPVVAAPVVAVVAAVDAAVVVPAEKPP